ncbi:TIGR03668 family PPOX class F420-dependent oxidoreductase [Intrasporangium mesophilum]
MPLGEPAVAPWVRERFAAGRVARLATLNPDGRPHLVPVTFVLERPADVVWITVDAKPKSTRRLRRLANIEADPRVSLVVDHYEEDWDRLWWVRADGSASVERVPTVAGDAAVIALRAKYPQEADADHLGPLIRVEVERWAAWSAAQPNQT